MYLCNKLTNRLLTSKNYSMIDLSIIVPVYNVEKYVRTCIESIYRQELDENRFELIIINDGTEDHSMEMIADIIQQHSNIIVIKQENQGLSVARNNGLAIAKGEYILMIDSDDLLISNSTNILLKKALETKAEIITADYLQMNNEEIKVFMSGSFQKEKENLIFEELTGEDFLISFIPGITAQDVPFANECYLKAKECIKAQWPLVIYRWGNPTQTTMFFTSQKAKDLCIAIQRIWSFTRISSLSTVARQKQIDITFKYFYRLISAITYGHIKELSTQFKIIDYMKQLEPGLTFKNGAKQKICTYMYQNMPHTLIRFYHIFYKVNNRLRIH